MYNSTIITILLWSVNKSFMSSLQIGYHKYFEREYFINWILFGLPLSKWITCTLVGLLIHIPLLELFLHTFIIFSTQFLHFSSLNKFTPTLSSSCGCIPTRLILSYLHTTSHPTVIKIIKRFHIIDFMEVNKFPNDFYLQVTSLEGGRSVKKYKMWSDVGSL